MKAPEPDYRFYTLEARSAIIERFSWPFEDWMQDWPLEVSEKIDLSFCLQEYPKLTNDDEKFLLMEGILFALDEVQGEEFEPYSQIAAGFLKTDFDTHEFTIYRWTLYGTNFEDGFTITPLMRDIWDARLK